MTKLKSYLSNSKKILIKLFLIYCSICGFAIIAATIADGPGIQSQVPAVQIDYCWAVATDGKLEATNTTMPYRVKDNDSKIIDLYTTIPENGFSVAAISFMSYQKNIWVYFEGEEIYRHASEQGNHKDVNGSGRVLCMLPENIPGKLLHIRLEKMSIYDSGAIGNIQLIDGSINEKNFIPTSNFVFIASIGFCIAGLLLLTTTWVYASFGAKISSLIYLSLFIIGTSLWVICNSGIAQMFTSNWALINNVEYMSLYILPVALWGFLDSNWKLKAEEDKAALYIMSGFFGIALTLKVLGIIDFVSVSKVFYTLIIFNLPSMAYTALNKFENKATSLKIFYFGILILVNFVLYEILRFYQNTVRSPVESPFVLGLAIMMVAMIVSFVSSTKETVSKLFEDRFYKDMAYKDALTGLSNRAKFEVDIRDCEDIKDELGTLIFVVADANYLKNINDTMGHVTGDAAIRTIASAMKISFNQIEEVYRIGGDEFCIIIKDETLSKVEICLKKLNEMLLNTELGFPVSLSYGFVEYNQNQHASLMELYKEADDRMYETKHFFRKSIEDNV